VNEDYIKEARIKACKKKRSYVSKQSAKKAMKKTSSKRWLVYKCDFCDYWHWATKKKGKNNDQ